MAYILRSMIFCNIDNEEMMAMLLYYNHKNDNPYLAMLWTKNFPKLNSLLYIMFSFVSLD